MVSRAQCSATFLHSAAVAAEETYDNAGVTTHIYALYDFDAGGERAFRTVEQELPEYAPDAPIYVDRLAVTKQQKSMTGTFRRDQRSNLILRPRSGVRSPSSSTRSSPRRLDRARRGDDRRARR